MIVEKYIRILSDEASLRPNDDKQNGSKYHLKTGGRKRERKELGTLSVVEIRSRLLKLNEVNCSAASADNKDYKTTKYKSCNHKIKNQLRK